MTLINLTPTSPTTAVGVNDTQIAALAEAVADAERAVVEATGARTKAEADLSSWRAKEAEAQTRLDELKAGLPTDPTGALTDTAGQVIVIGQDVLA